MKIETGFGVTIEIDHENEKVRVVNKIAKTEFTEFGITRSVM